LIREKLGKGYRKVGGSKSGPPVEKKPTPTGRRAAGQPLSSAVLRQLKRLGAVLSKRPGGDVVPLAPFTNISFSRLPKEARNSKASTNFKAWLKERDRATIRWQIGGAGARDPLGELHSVPPAIASFTRDLRWRKPVYEDYGDRVEEVSFSGASGGLDLDVDGQRRILIVIASTVENYDMTYLDLLDTSADPMIYCSDQDQLDVTRTKQRLSGFLRGLTKSAR
jgi:hypothetical protein